MSKKLEDAKPGNLIISVIRKVIKEEQGDSNMGVESNDGDVVKDIEKAADAFASRVGACHNVEKDTIQKGKGNGSSPKEKPYKPKAKARVIPRERAESSERLKKKN